MNIKKLILNFLPGFITPAGRYRSITNKLLATSAETYPTIMSGLFKGLNYLDTAGGSELYPKLLGTYESELYDILKMKMRDGINHLIVAGTGEGYFAVGINKRFKINKNSFFEISSSSREKLKRLSEINDFSNYSLYETCSPQSLKNVLCMFGPGFLLMDIEGAELECLDPITVEELTECEILVEIHDFISKNTGNSIIERFTESHTIQKFQATRKSYEDFPLQLSLLDKLIIKKKYIEQLMDESRPQGMYWLLLTPKNAIKA